MTEKRTIKLIREAVRSGKLKEPFTAKDVHEACPSISLSTCRTFLPKHRVGKLGKDTKLFIRLSTGLYKLNK